MLARDADRDRKAFQPECPERDAPTGAVRHRKIIFLALRTIWSAAVICPASVCAEHMSAGLDEVRRPGSLSWMRAFAHVFWRVVPGLRWRPCRSSRLVALAKLEPVNLLCEHFLRRPAAFLCLCEHLGAEAFAGLHHRPEDPGELVGQRHRNQPRQLLR